MATNYRTYDTITAAELREIRHGWTESVVFGRYVNAWLMDHGFSWDLDRTDDTNRADFAALVEKAWNAR
jgi:hypothetical protein